MTAVPLLIFVDGPDYSSSSGKTNCGDNTNMSSHELNI